MAVAAPIVVFGFLYVLRVQPERAAAAESRSELAAARAELSRRRAFVTPTTGVTEVPALDTFDARTTEADRVGDVADALSALLKSPAVGGVSNVSIETGRAGGAADRLDGPVVLADGRVYACYGDVRRAIRADWPIFLESTGAADNLRSAVRRAHARTRLARRVDARKGVIVRVSSS